MLETLQNNRIGREKDAKVCNGLKSKRQKHFFPERWILNDAYEGRFQFLK